MRGCTCGYEGGQHKPSCAISHNYPLKQGQELRTKAEIARDRRAERQRQPKQAEGDKKTS